MVLKTPKGRNLLFFCAAHFCDSRATIFRFYCGMFSLGDSNACSSGQVTLGRRDNVHSWVEGLRQKISSPPVTKPPQLSWLPFFPPSSHASKHSPSNTGLQPVPCRKHILENNENTQTREHTDEWWRTSRNLLQWRDVCNVAWYYAPWDSKPSINATLDTHA